MKIVCIGDIHGRTCWKQIIEKHPDANRIIFMGDYVDAYENYTGLEQLENLREIIEYKQLCDAQKRWLMVGSNAKKLPEVILLVGNHDFQYWPSIDEWYSGFQPNMKASFRYEFDTYKELFQMCHIDEYDTIYSHAGFTETFINQKIGQFSEKNVNELFKYKPYLFKLVENDRSGCGDDVRQSCIWVRPESLYKDKLDNFQIVGHTHSGRIEHKEKSERKGFYVIDTLPNEYLVRIDKEFMIEKL